MRTVPLGQVVAAESALNQIAAQRLPFKTAYLVNKAVKAIRKEIAFHNEKRDELIREFGAERPLTDQERAVGAQSPIIEVIAEKRATFFEKYRELLAVEVDVPAQLTPAILDACQVSVNDLVALEPFLVEEV